MKKTTTSIRRLASVAGAAALSGVMIAGVSAPALAYKGQFKDEPNWTGPTTNDITDDIGGVANGTMVGAYIPTSGPLKDKRVWCADPGLEAPLGTAFAADAHERVTAPELAYVLYKYDKNRGDKADRMAWDMAISAYLKGSDEIRHRNILTKNGNIGSPAQMTKNPGWNLDSKRVKEIGASTFNKTVVPNAQKHYEEIVKAAKNRPKGQETPTKAGVSISEGLDKVSVDIRDKDNTGASGLDATVTLKNATFEDGSTTKKYKTGEKVQSFDISVSKAGEVGASVDVAEIPPTEVIRWTPKDYTNKRSNKPGADNREAKDGYNRYSVQEVVERTPGVKISASTKANAVNKPNVVTTINDSNLQPGDEVYDNFTVSGLVGEDTVDVNHELWYSPTKPKRSKEKPENAVKVGEVTSKGVGNGDHKTSTVKIPEDIQGGWFSWRETIAPKEGITEGWESDYFIPEETGLVKYNPQGHTQISQEQADALPLEVDDTGNISGGMPGQTLVVSLEAFQDDDCTIEQSTEIPEGAKSLGVTTLEVTLDEKGNGTYTSDKLKLAEDLVEQGQCGAVTIVETIAKTDSSEKVVSDYGIPSESVVINIPAPPEPENPTEPKPDQPKQPNPEQPKNNPTVKTGGFTGDGSPYIAAAIAAALAAAGGAGYIVYRRRSKLNLDQGAQD